MGDERELFLVAFGKGYQRDVIMRLNVFDSMRKWPAYENEEDLGMFADAMLNDRWPVIGFGKKAEKLNRFSKDAVYAPKEMLDATAGIAGYVNRLMLDAGLNGRMFERGEIQDLFLNFDRGFQQDLLTAITFEALIEFYQALAKQWDSWFYGGEVPGTVSPSTIWSNYALYELRPIRDDLENLFRGHKEAALNVILDLGRQKSVSICAICKAVTKFTCAACEKRSYCSVKCQRVDWRQGRHSIECTKKATVK
jgi:hypothetical protein